MKTDALHVQTLLPQQPVTLTVPVGITIAEMEKLLIEATLRWTRGNRRRAAIILDIDRTTLYNKMRRHRISLVRASENEPPGIG